MTYGGYGLERFIKFDKPYGLQTTAFPYSTDRDIIPVTDVQLYLDEEVADSTGKTILQQIDAIDTSTVSKIGSKSLALTNKRLLAKNHAGFDFGLEDFTIETWFYPISLPSSGTVFELGSWPSTVLLRPQGTGTLGIYVNGRTFSTGYTFATNQWYHFAFQRRSGEYRVYVDGILVRTFTRTFDITGKDLGIGYSIHYTSQRMNGYLDGFRVINKALYTDNFDPDKSAMQSISYSEYGWLSNQKYKRRKVITYQ
jgi:hypothetical protein